ncbi:MAG: hypothetical protein KF744_06160 [Taibaiella sp.]|nr:hypothetical protein [Taibaiella sp.]
MKSVTCHMFLLTSLLFVACRKSSGPSPATIHTDGIGGARNWHVASRYKVHRFIAPDSAVYSDTTYYSDQNFALSVIGADTILFDNEKYGYTETTGSIRKFPIWHKQYSGSTSNISYNADSNTVRIYVYRPGANAESETSYYSY